MQQRIDVTKVSPDAYKAMAALQAYVDQSGLDAKLRELDQDPRLADQRLRVLPRHAHARRPQDRRDRRAHASARRLARSADLYRARTGRAGLDRGPHPGRRRPRARRGLRAGAPAVFRKGDRRSHARRSPPSTPGTGSRSRSARCRRSAARRSRPDVSRSASAPWRIASSAARRCRRRRGSSSAAFSSSVRMARAGAPTISELSGKLLPSVTSAPAPTSEFLPILAPLSTIAPMPIRLLSPTVQPCR